MVINPDSFICKRPFFANKKVNFANLSRTPRLSFAGVSCWNPGSLCTGQSLHGPLDRQSYTVILYNIFCCYIIYYINIV